MSRNGKAGCERGGNHLWEKGEACALRYYWRCVLRIDLYIVAGFRIMNAF